MFFKVYYSDYQKTLVKVSVYCALKILPLLIAGEEKAEKIRESDVVGRLQNEALNSASKLQEKASSTIEKTNRFVNTFSKTLKEEWKKEEMKIEEQKKLDQKKKGER